MNSYSKQIEIKIEKYQTNEIIVARKLYVDSFSYMPEMTFFKVMERLVSQGRIIRISKGIYCIPKKTRFGVIPVSENEIVEYYTEGKKSGMVIGYHLFNSKGLTTQISKSTKVYSNRLEEQNKTIRNVSIARLNVEFTEELIKHIEAFEILENYTNIEDINSKSFARYIKKIAEFYKNSEAIKALETGKFKKRTIAFMQMILSYYNVPNTLSRYISATSSFDIPKMEEIYAAAS